MGNGIEPKGENSPYFVNDSRGIAYCLKAETGDVVYEEKISPELDRWHASPVLSQDRIF